MIGIIAQWSIVIGGQRNVDGWKLWPAAVEREANQQIETLKDCDILISDCKL